ncbi:MAG TPA: GNAT family N-acetyltransferase [Bdellovibrionota bacterium]|nr:GNAT family N-acetyltransferase [Bdellovibrionota bacterium]
MSGQLEHGPQGPSPKALSRLCVDVIEGERANRQFGDLLDKAFATVEGAHFFDDFPVWDERHGHPEQVLRAGVFAGKKRDLICSSSVRLADLRIGPSSQLPVAIIGAVATDPKYRGHGFASRAVSLCIEWAVERGAAAAFLWGSEHTLYRRLGFELCGEQVRVPLRAMPRLASAKRTAVHAGWCSGLAECLKKRPNGLVVHDSDLIWLKAHKNVRWFWTGDPSRPSAYAALGRGMDLGGLVHEWGGATEDLLAVLANIREQVPESALLGSPRHLRETGLSGNASDCFGLEPEYLCMARILDPVKLYEAYRPDGVFKRELVSGMNERELTRLFFGPLDRTQSPYAEIGFPFPLWIWGLDSA